MSKRSDPKFANTGVQHLFIKTDGEQFTNNTFGKCFAAFWDKSGVRRTNE